MKIKKIGIFILVILSIISVALFASCKKKNESPDDSSSVTQSQSEEKISLSVSSADIRRRIKYHMFLRWSKLCGMEFFR